MSLNKISEAEPEPEMPFKQRVSRDQRKLDDIM